MKKAKKVMLIISLIFCIFLTVGMPQLSYADELDPYSYEPSGEIDEEFVTNYGGTLSNIFFTVAVIVAVISIMIVGLMYIVGSTQEKADYKKNLIPIVVGIAFITFLFSILSIIAKTAEGL